MSVIVSGTAPVRAKPNARLQDEIASDDESDNSDSKFADVILSENKKQSTKDGYQHKLQRLFLWMKKRHPQLLDSDDKPIVVPIHWELIKSFFASISRAKRNKGNNEGNTDDWKLVSPSTVGGFRRP